MRSSDHTPPLPVFSQNGLQQLVAGTLGGHQTGSLRDLVERLRNTAETPSTLPRRSQLQVVQQRLQAQYDVTPENGTPAGIPSRQQLEQVMNEIPRYESQLSLLPPSPTQAATSAQQRAAQDTAAQLKPLLAHHTIFTASPAQRVNLLSHFHALSNSDQRFAQPQTQSELASFINQRENPNASSRLDQLQIMTAFLRGSPNAAISSRINTLLSSQLAQDMTLEQFLVPRAAGSINGDAVLAQFANLTPEAKTLFLLRLARATLTICQLITSELVQTRQAVNTSISSTETSPSTTPEPTAPVEQTDCEDETSPSTTPEPTTPVEQTDSEDESPLQSTEVTPVIELAPQQPSADAVTEASLDDVNAAQTSPEETGIATASPAPVNRNRFSRFFSKLFRHKPDDKAIKPTFRTFFWIYFCAHIQSVPSLRVNLPILFA